MVNTGLVEGFDNDRSGDAPVHGDGQGVVNTGLGNDRSGDRLAGMVAR